jgi:hypothetical protein
LSAGAFVKKLVVALLLTATAVYLCAQPAHTVFNWAFVKRDADSSPASIDFKERVDIAPGDLFKIYVEPLRGAIIYLFLHDAQGDLHRLFPDSFGLFDSGTYQGTRHFIPEGDNWFTLDSTRGTERFYLVVSSERLRLLE